MFQKKVFGPVCLELNVRNTKFVNAIENALRNQLKVRWRYHMMRLVCKFLTAAFY